MTTTDTSFASAVSLRDQAGLVLLRLRAMRQRAAGIRERLHRLFVVTKAGAQITVQLAQGSRLETIAEARGVSVDTVRAQVRSVFHKTGIQRQGEPICPVSWLAIG